MSNRSLWDSVKVTDPLAVKPITGKSYKGNSPKPYWLIERATETFGPVGIGWGVTVKSERFERLSETDVLHVAVVGVWFVRDGVRSETFEQMGGTKACYMTGKGSLMVDEDAGKKSVTAVVLANTRRWPRRPPPYSCRSARSCSVCRNTPRAWCKKASPGGDRRTPRASR